MATQPIGPGNLMPYEQETEADAPDARSLFLKELEDDPDFADTVDEGSPDADEQVEPEAEVAEGDPEEEAPGAEASESEDDEEAEEAPEVDEDAELYVVKVDGEEIEVPLDELLAGYSRTADYTRKTQAAAADRQKFQQEAMEDRRALIQAYETTREQRTRYIGALEAFQELQKGIAPTVDDSLKETDPAKWAAQREELRTFNEQQALAERLLQKAHSEQTEEAQRQQVMWAQVEQQKVLEARPQWSDPEVLQKETAAMSEYALASGFTPQEVQTGFVDHRLVDLLEKAMKYDALESSRETIKAKKKTAKVIKPGSRKPPASARRKAAKEREALEKRLEKTGRPEDARALFENMFPDG